MKFDKLSKTSITTSNRRGKGRRLLTGWKFLGFMYSMCSGTISFWEDGRRNKGKSSISAKSSFIATQFPFFIGKYYTGKIACVQIYDQVLTKEQVNEARKTCIKYQ